MYELVVRESGIDATGVFANRSFSVGDRIHVMGGRRRSFLQCAGDVLLKRSHFDDPLQIGPNCYIDLDAFSVRFNHSCAPNAAICGEADLVAIKPIAPGEEITFDYAATVTPSFYSWLWDMPCQCGSKDCRESIGDATTIPRGQFMEMRARRMMQDYMLARADNVEAWRRVLSPLRRLNRLTRAGFSAASAVAGRMIGALRTKKDVPAATSSIRDFAFELPGNRCGVLLLHGLSGTPAEMRETAEAFAAKGYTVSCPQLPGHGGTFDDLKASTWQDWAACCEDALRDLSKRCDSVVVGGLSTGAVLSLHLAAKFPNRVRGVLLLAPTLWLNGWVVPAYARLFRLVLQKPVANLFDFPDLPPHGVKDPEIRSMVAASIHQSDGPSGAGLPITPGGAVIEHRWLVDNVRPRLKRVDQPVLIIHPREDDYANINNISYLISNLAGSVETLTLDDCYHIITTDRQRHQVIERSLAFLGQIFETPRRVPFRVVVNNRPLPDYLAPDGTSGRQ